MRDWLVRYAVEYLVYERSSGCLVRQQSSKVPVVSER